jgi:hypothetical protein
LPQVIAPPTLTSSGGTISYPATLINYGGTKTVLCEIIEGPLPITLQNFKVHKANKTTAELLWQTATEINNRGFEIQRSFDGNNFTDVKFVPGAGNADHIKSYGCARTNREGILPVETN